MWAFLFLLATYTHIISKVNNFNQYAPHHPEPFPLFFKPRTHHHSHTTLHPIFCGQPTYQCWDGRTIESVHPSVAGHTAKVYRNTNVNRNELDIIDYLSNLCGLY